MSSLGDLLLNHVKAQNKGDSPQILDSASDQNVPENSKNDEKDNESDVSSTDDYVRELLDPDDRPRNVWRVVEDPVKVHSHSRGKDRIAESNSMTETYLETGQKLVTDGSDSQFTSKNFYLSKQQDDSGLLGDVCTSMKCNIQSQELEDSNNKESHNNNDKPSNEDIRDHSISNQRHDSRDNRHTNDRKRRYEERDLGRNEKHRARDKNQDSYSGSVRIKNQKDGNKRKSRSSYDLSDDEDVGYRSRTKRRSRSRSRVSSRVRERSRSISLSPMTRRNSRTILVMQLNPKVRPVDLEDFFSDVGKVREVRLIMDSKTRRHKGIAYIEFEDTATAARAFSFSGRKFFGAPVVIQPVQSDRFKSTNDRNPTSTSHSTSHAAPYTNSRSHLPPNCFRVYVGGLNINLSEDMIKSVFEPFGPIVRLELMRDRVTNIPRGYAFITYAYIEDGQNAVKCLDGLELGGKAIRVSKSTDKSERITTSGTDFDSNRSSGQHESDSDSQPNRQRDVSTSVYE